jgi:hypothetical protein
MRFILYDGEKIVTESNISFAGINGDNHALVSDKEFFHYNSMVSWRKFLYKIEKNCVVEKSEQEKLEINKNMVECAKTRKKREVDIKTKKLINKGFTYKENLISLSAEAQINWLGVFCSRFFLSYPYKATTKDDKEFVLENQSDVEIFYFSGVSFVNNVISAGRELKIEIDLLVSLEEVMMFQDLR